MPNVMTIDEPASAQIIMRLIVRDNPHLHRGEDFVNSSEHVKDGQLLTSGANIDSSWTLVHSQMLKLPYPVDRSQSYTFNFLQNKKFIHFFKCTRHPLLNADGFEAAAGDEVDIIDKVTKRSRRVRATPALLDQTKFVIFRFAAS